MKISPVLLLAVGLTAGAMVLPNAARSQSPSPNPAATPSVSGPATSDTAAAGSATETGHGDRRGEFKERWATLTPQEQARVKAARAKAMQDPAVKAAEGEKETNRRAYHKAVQEATLRADPTIGPILEKLHPHEGHRGNQ